jgi:hypothetical protein
MSFTIFFSAKGITAQVATPTQRVRDRKETGRTVEVYEIYAEIVLWPVSSINLLHVR